MTKQRIAYFISDHGFGHATRSCAVIQELIQCEVPVCVITSVPIWLFKEILSTMVDSIQFISTQVDVGFVQKTPTTIDHKQTLNNLEQFWGNINPKVTDIAHQLSTWKATRVVYDITPLGPLVAEKLNIPSIAISNFSWDWLYEKLSNQVIEYAKYVKFISNAYKKTKLFLKLPYCAQIKSFESIPFKQLGWISLRSTIPRNQVRKLLELDMNTKYALYTFGGHEFQVDIKQWKIPKDWKIVLVEVKNQNDNPSVKIISREFLNKNNIQRVDLVNAMDIVVGKTGYGTVSECIVHGVPMLGSGREGFDGEHDLLMKALKETVGGSEVNVKEELITARFFEKADLVLNSKKNLISNVTERGEVQAVKFILSI